MNASEVKTLQQAREQLALIDEKAGGLPLIETRRLLERLMVEHKRHRVAVAGKEKLKVGFDYEKKQWKNVTDAWLGELEALHPNVCVVVEFFRMAVWLTSDPKHRKYNHATFIRRWLRQEQDRGSRDYRPWLDRGDRTREESRALYRKWALGKESLTRMVTREVATYHDYRRDRKAGNQDDPMGGMKPHIAGDSP